MELIYKFTKNQSEGFNQGDKPEKKVEIVSLTYKSLTAFISSELKSNKVSLTGPNARTVDLGTANPTNLVELYTLMGQKMHELTFSVSKNTMTNNGASVITLTEFYAQGTFGQVLGITLPVTIGVGDHVALNPNLSLFSPTMKFRSGNIVVLLAGERYGQNVVFYPTNPIKGTLGTVCHLTTRYDDVNHTIDHSYDKDFTITIVYHTL